MSLIVAAAILTFVITIYDEITMHNLGDRDDDDV